MNNADGGNIIFRFKGDKSGLDKSISGVTSGIKGMTKSILVATGVTKALSTGMNLIASSTDTAIQRIDTFNQYPKVLKNFGVSVEEANKSIKRIDKSVRGLPTSLDQAVAGVQDLFVVTKDLTLAEEMFKAINDSAMIFAKGSTEAVQRFSYAYKQSLSAGKIDAANFRQMNEAIPGVMAKVAEAMGITFNELKEGLSDGSISIDEFNNTLKKLDSEGGAGMKSFAEVAKTSTNGIQTSITNMKVAVARGVANVIDSIDKGLKDANIENGIAGIVSKIGTGFETGLTKLGEEISPMISQTLSGKITPEQASYQLTQKLTDGLKIAIDTVKQNIPKIASTGADIVAGLVKGLGDAMPIIIPAVISLIDKITSQLLKDENMSKLTDAGGKLAGGLLKGIANNMTENGIKTAFNFLTLTVRVPLSIGRNIVINIAKGIAEKLGLPKQKAEEIEKKIKSALKNLPKTMFNLGKNIILGLINGMASLAGSAFKKAGSIASGIAKTITSKLKIGSPSKITTWQGEMTGEGFIVGLENMKKKIMSTVFDTFDISPNLVGSMNNHYSPNVIVNNQMNMSTDPLGQVVGNIKTFANGSKNDYNYGMGA